MTNYIKCVLVLMMAAIAAGCTMTDTDPPPLAGPSEMSLSLAITANPDVLSLDGSSQTLDHDRGARHKRAAGAECPAPGSNSRGRSDSSTSGLFPHGPWSLAATAARRLHTRRPRSSAGRFQISSSASRRREPTRLLTSSGSSRSGSCRLASSARDQPRSSRSFRRPRLRLRMSDSTDRLRPPGLAPSITGTSGISATVRAGPRVSSTHQYDAARKLPRATHGYG